MDLNYSPEELEFRDEVRAFLRARMPHEIARKVLEHKRLGKEDHLRWQKILSEQGWMAPNWPVEHGGSGWSAVQQHIFDEECGEAGAPRVIPFGVNMVGPVIIAFGSPWQKQHYLPRILSNEDWWCQGYSEPGAGSDLAALKTRAERKGDRYVVNGQKTWTTLAQHADMIFCLVRTASTGKRQEGISFLLIDMHAPGITVRPIITLEGEHEVNEVWFEDVEVPAENLVGEEGRGWTYAKFLLSHERTGIAGVGASKRELRSLKYIASQEQRNGRPLIEDLRFRDRSDGAGDHQPAHARGRARGSRAGAGGFHPKDQGHGGAAGHHRADDGGGRALRAAAPASGVGRPLARRARRARVRRAARCTLLQLPQGQHLRRLQRDPAQHHRAAHPGIVGRATAPSS
jgi:alkylation response protein AidB-like acyl-CoA dehydrogenase